MPSGSSGMGFHQQAKLYVSIGLLRGTAKTGVIIS